MNPAQHDTPIDLILYTSIPEPGNSSNLIRGLEKQTLFCSHLYLLK